MFGSLTEAIASGLLGGSIADALTRRADRRALRDHGRVRCGIRAVNARVHEIGTEWSSGVAEIASGGLRFRPEMGILGDREIAVIAVRPADGGRSEATRELRTFVLSTAEGDLHWSVPAIVADQAVGLLGVTRRA